MYETSHPKHGRSPVDQRHIGFTGKGSSDDLSRTGFGVALLAAAQELVAGVVMATNCYHTV